MTWNSQSEIAPQMVDVRAVGSSLIEMHVEHFTLEEGLNLEEYERFQTPWCYSEEQAKAALLKIARETGANLISTWASEKSSISVFGHELYKRYRLSSAIGLYSLNVTVPKYDREDSAIKFVNERGRFARKAEATIKKLSG